MRLTVNGKRHDLDIEPEMPLLWVLRDELGITGPKYGCGAGLCGACTVHVDGAAVRSCSISAGEVRGSVTTIEGLGTPANPHLVQQAWIEHQVAQCGYCQSGQMMTAAAFLSKNPRSVRDRYCRRHERKSLQMRNLSSHPQRRQNCSPDDEGEIAWLGLEKLHDAHF